MGKALLPVTINGIEFDALISEERVLEAAVPEYTVETGFTVSDSIILGAERLSMVLYVSRTPVTWHSRHGNDPMRVDQIISRLEELYFSKTPVTIYTTDNTYTNMAIESVTLKKSLETGYDREIPISFKKVRETEAQTTMIPESYGKSGETGAPAGSANTSTGGGGNGDTGGAGSSGGGGSGDGGSDDSDSSILYDLARGAGLIP